MYSPEIIKKAKLAGINPAMLSVVVVPKVEEVVPTPIKTQPASYNLRSRNSLEGDYHNKSKKYKLKQPPAPIWIPKESKSCFRNKLLSQVDLKTYHQTQDEFAKRLIDLTYTIEKSQIDSFTFQSKRFIAMVWLTTLRIFEYQPFREEYLEVKRMPCRYIKLSSHLLTSVHHCDSYFYLAYLWGNTDDNRGGTSPFIERRDMFGNLIGSPRFYDQIITSIYSDQDFIYAMTLTNVIYVHQRELFDHICYRVDFNHLTSEQIVKYYVDSPSYSSFTKFPSISATKSNLMITHYTVLDHKVKYEHHFGDDFLISSIGRYRGQKKSALYIIHRNIINPDFLKLDKTSTKIDVGYFAKKGEEKPFKFTQNLDYKYLILQVEIYGDKIYLFGYTEDDTGKKIFEVGCLSASNLKPIKTSILPDSVDVDAKILVHDNNIVIVKNSQKFITIDNSQTTDRHKECPKCDLLIPNIDIQKHELHGHRTMFTI